jgi:lactate racemase
MTLPLGYGRTTVPFDLDEVELAAVLSPDDLVTPTRTGADVASALNDPTGSPPLAELARGADSVGILVSGKDRITRADVFMPPLLETLHRAGVASDRITVFTATGTHVRFTDDDRATVLGLGFDPSIRVVRHDCTDATSLVELGRTATGNDIWVNREAYEQDVKVLTGRITHHYFAGFTAGRKSVLPGVAGLASIERNHRLVLSGPPEHPRHPEVRNGSLERNPIHLEMLEAAAMFEPTFLLNTIVGTAGRLLDVAAGDPVTAHLDGCRTVAERFEVAVPEPLPLAVASCGGDPYDCSFMQAIKTLMNTADAVADGGVFVLLAECPEGMKAGFLDWDEEPSMETFARHVLDHYDLTGHNTYLLREITRRITVILVSSCPPKDVERMGMTPAGNLDAALAIARARVGARAPAYAIPFGNVTVVDVA